MTAMAGADDVRVARVHLRLGQLTLARAEFEDLFRRDLLDTSSLAALAEARWRTGAAAAAAEAAQAHLDAGGADDVALCIAVEAAAADGRSADARALMDRLPASDAVALDALFAGMPRRAYWPAGPVDRSDLDDLRQGDARGGVGGRRGSIRPPASEAPAEVAHQPGPTEVAPNLRAIPGPHEVMNATGDASRAGAVGAAPFAGSASAAGAAAAAGARAARPGERRIKGQLDPTAELARARQDLESRPERAFLRLALVLRHDPTLAPMVLEALRLRREAAAALLRGDAQRLLGRHLEAEAAYDSAAESLEVS